VARYPEKGPILASGWLLGEEFLLDQASTEVSAPQLAKLAVSGTN
jgi:hypothetical protein